MNVQPTFVGYVPELADALLLFQAVVDGILPPVVRRPADTERRDIIFSGAVFIFNEQESGIKRWTDHIIWSPSRILGNFLVYRQLECSTSTSEKRISGRAAKRPAQYSSDSPSNENDQGHAEIKTEERYQPRQSNFEFGTLKTPRPFNPEWSLYGSLNNGNGTKFDYKENGLVKKTISLHLKGRNQTLHLISYYQAEDVLTYKLCTPKEDPRIASLQINTDLAEACPNYKAQLTLNIGQVQDNGLHQAPLFSPVDYAHSPIPLDADPHYANRYPFPGSNHRLVPSSSPTAMYHNYHLVSQSIPGQDPMHGYSQPLDTHPQLINAPPRGMAFSNHPAYQHMSSLQQPQLPWQRQTHTSPYVRQSLRLAENAASVRGGHAPRQRYPDGSDGALFASEDEDLYEPPRFGG